MEKVAVIMCNNMHMDIENANKLLTRISNSGVAQIETDYTKADMVIVITCAFGSGKEKSMRVIADVEANMSDSAKLVVTGCMVKTNAQLLGKVPKATVMELSQVMNLFQAPQNVCEIKNFIPQNKVIISTGCLKKCSYCVYPNITDGYISKPREQVLSEVERLYKNETTIYITGGLETSDYGIDLYHTKKDYIEESDACKEANCKGYNITKLVGEICEKYPDCNYIIGWFHPSGLTEEFIEVMAKYTNIIEIMLHIQHVSNKVLKAMHRPNFEFTDERIRKIKKLRPDMAISTEVIVGFPGETEEEFLQLAKYLDKGYFTDIGVACYEQVANTLAGELPQVPLQTRVERMNFLLNRYKGASPYPSPKVKESQLEGLYLKSKSIMADCKGLVLKAEARQQYKFVAGTDSSLKLHIQETIFHIYETVLNARDELEISRVKAEIERLYTEIFRLYMFKVCSNTIKKPAMIERFKYILLD